MKIKALRGTKDILPEEVGLWRFIEQKAHAICRTYGYQEIRTPVLEETRLFTRSIGASSDIVRKEMYSFLDRKKRHLCLRPEGTASVVRAYLEHGLDKSTGLAKFYYFGPMFRAERPQAGRLRQFHHLGVEAIGVDSPYLDAEVLCLALDILQQVGVEKAQLEINHIGCQNDRKKYKHALKKGLKNKLKYLCGDCRKRYKLNILRVFDCKHPSCRAEFQQLPPIIKTLCADCAANFQKLRQILDSLQIPYTVNPYLVRGLDYYTKACFEIIHPSLGAQNALGAGGRYDSLVSDLGGAQKPAIGFALGVERMVNALTQKPKQQNLGEKPAYVYIATIGEEARQTACRILHSLREKQIPAEMDYQEKSLKGQMRQADRLNARYVLILGEEELKRKSIILRDMRAKTQKEVALDSLSSELTANK